MIWLVTSRDHQAQLVGALLNEQQDFLRRLATPIMAYPIRLEDEADARRATSSPSANTTIHAAEVLTSELAKDSSSRAAGGTVGYHSRVKRSVRLMSVTLWFAFTARVAAAHEAGWTWAFNATVFVDANMQNRGDALSDHVFESQNWIAMDASRPAGRGTLTLVAILSAEPVTMHEVGSPQLFQISGPFLDFPVGDHQTPRDLFSGLGVSFRRRFSWFKTRVDAAIVGSPALGPLGYDSRPTASLNPQVPLSHGMIDATEASSSVLTAGLFLHGVGIEASAFRGRELNAHRFDLELGTLDSWAVRGSYRWRRWTGQVSTGRLHRIHTWTPFDTTRTTASIGCDVSDHFLSLLAAWGHDRDRFGGLDSYLIDASMHLSPRDHVYLRGERVSNDFLMLASIC